MPSMMDVFQAKPSQDIFHVTPDTTVFEAIKIMADKGIGALLVIEEGELAGIFSERDYTRKIALMERSSRTTPVRAIMTSKLIVASPASQLTECLSLMTDSRIRHLPIVEGKKVVGMLSLGDLVKALIREQQKLIDQLQTYISG